MSASDFHIQKGAECIPKYPHAYPWAAVNAFKRMGDVTRTYVFIFHLSSESIGYLKIHILSLPKSLLFSNANWEI